MATQKTKNKAAPETAKWKEGMKDIKFEQMQGIEEAFRMFDRNKDGTISISELRTIMQILGNNPTEKDIKKVMREADKDGNGTLDFDEFALLMSKYLKKPEQEEIELLESFRVFDKDNSGYIELSEIKELMKSIGEKLTDEQIEDIFNKGDLNGDGRLDYQEFAKLMSQKTM